MSQVMILIVITLLTLSSSSFWNLWVSLEVYSFFLMPWLMESEGKASKTSIFFYFLMQFLASTCLLVGSFTMVNKFCSILLLSSVLMKMSCFPFHSWFIEVLPKVSWKKIIVLVSLSKFLPLAMLMLFLPPNGFLWVLVCGVGAALGGFMVVCLRKLIAYSSVAHSSWLVICTCTSKSIGVAYMVTYVLSSLPLCFLFMKESLTSMKSLLEAKKGSIQLITLVLILSGLPPFLGFFPKLLVIQLLAQNSIFLESMVLGVLSILPMYFYFKIGLSSFNMCSSHEFTFLSSLSFTVVVILLMSVFVLVVL